MSDRFEDAPSEHAGGPAAIRARNARQGRRGSRILTVLLSGLGLTAIGFAIVWAFWAGPFAQAPVDNGAQVEDAAAFRDSATQAPNEMTSSGIE